MKKIILSRELAKLHTEFRVFKPKLFRLPAKHNIIQQLKRMPDLSYLSSFYEKYQADYLKYLKQQSAQQGSFALAGVARTTDLPFVGQSVVSTGRARYMFIFEGALGNEERLSVTVLACLWPATPLRDGKPYEEIFKTFWPRRRHAFEHIFKTLGITFDIADHSFVIDAVRIGGRNKTIPTQPNRDLLLSEIDLFQPEVVVLVGNTASRIIGNAEMKRKPDLFIKVPFPTKRNSPSTIQKHNLHYARLIKRFDHNKPGKGSTVKLPVEPDNMINSARRNGAARDIITKVRADELLRFLPGFSVPGRKFVREWKGGQAGDGPMHLPFPEYEHDVEEFYQAAQQEWWQDYAYDPDRAREMLADDVVVDVADILAIKTMLTYCASAEKFSEGPALRFSKRAGFSDYFNASDSFEQACPEGFSFYEQLHHRGELLLIGTGGTREMVIADRHPPCLSATFTTGKDMKPCQHHSVLIAHTARCLVNFTPRQ